MRFPYGQLPEAEKVKDRPVWQAVREALKAHPIEHPVASDVLDISRVIVMLTDALVQPWRVRVAACSVVPPFREFLDQAKHADGRFRAAADEHLQSCALLVIGGVDSQRVVLLARRFGGRHQHVGQTADRVGTDRVDLDDARDVDVSGTPDGLERARPARQRVEVFARNPILLADANAFQAPRSQVSANGSDV